MQAWQPQGAPIGLTEESFVGHSGSTQAEIQGFLAERSVLGVAPGGACAQSCQRVEPRCELDPFSQSGLRLGALAFQSEGRRQNQMRKIKPRIASTGRSS